MLIWRGWGIGVLIVAALANLTAQTLINLAMGDDNYGKTHGWTWLVSMGVAAAAVWMIGSRINDRPGRRVIDADTGEALGLKNPHDLFWIPFRYWALPIAVLGCWFSLGK